MLPRFIFTILFIAAIAVIPQNSYAEITNPKIVVVNIKRILDESKAAKDLSSQIEKKKSTYQAQITAKEEKLKKEEESLIQQKNVLSKEALTEKQKQFIDEINGARKDIAQKKIKLDNGYKKALADIQKAVKDIVEELAVEKGFNIAVPTSQLIYATADLDISDEVLARLNKKLPKVNLKFE